MNLYCFVGFLVISIVFFYLFLQEESVELPSFIFDNLFQPDMIESIKMKGVNGSSLVNYDVFRIIYMLQVLE
jgi:hypothetical protein